MKIFQEKMNIIITMQINPKTKKKDIIQEIKMALLKKLENIIIKKMKKTKMK
jgi:hypothetical protein